MGQGEPLLNYDNVVQAIRILNQSAEVGIRHITVSTSGIVPKIYQLAEEAMQIVLAVSLHAPDDETRSRIMPINTKWPVADLMEAVHAYVAKTKRRVTIEYVMLKGVNDSQAHAHDLGRLLKGLKCNVNLIPYNPIGDEYDFERPSNEVIVRFLDTVMTYGKKVTVRLERGVDIAAACGQLANQYQKA
jgi:23S rRNA (adenine2503-C2)-methyltransferase